MTDLTTGAYLGSQARIGGNSGRLHETWMVLSEFVPSSVADILSFVIRGFKEICRVSILEGRLRALESTLST